MKFTATILAPPAFRLTVELQGMPSVGQYPVSLFPGLGAQCPGVLEEPKVCGENGASRTGAGALEGFLEEGGREQARTVRGFRSCVQPAGHRGGACLGTGRTAHPLPGAEVTQPGAARPVRGGEAWSTVWHCGCWPSAPPPGAVEEPKWGPLQAVPSRGSLGADERSSHQGP